MKTERAIELLHRLQDEQFDGIHGDERREALEMAVRALEQNLVKESGGLVKDLVKDCISRKMAIDAINNCYCGGEDSCGEPWIYEDDAIKAVEQLPSAQSETHDKRTETHACDLINRQQAIDAVVSAMIDGADAELVEGVMELLPSAQRKKGKWIDYIGEDLGIENQWMRDDGKTVFVQCDQCKTLYVRNFMNDWRWCPHCGARMDGESE